LSFQQVETTNGSRHSSLVTWRSDTDDHFAISLLALAHAAQKKPIEQSFKGDSSNSKAVKAH